MKLRSSVLSLSVLAVLAGAAAHADNALGQIQTINPVEQNLTLDNGTSYHFSDHAVARKLFGFRPRDAVTIEFVPQAGTNTGKAIASASADTQVGTVASVNPEGKTVTLDDGLAFNFGAYDNAKDMLTGYKPGDLVRINYFPSANGLNGVTISEAVLSEAHGIITHIDRVRNTVTLDHGPTYALDSHSNGQSILTGYRVGDAVQLHFKAGQSGLVNAVSEL